MSICPGKAARVMESCILGICILFAKVRSPISNSGAQNTSLGRQTLSVVADIMYVTS